MFRNLVKDQEVQAPNEVWVSDLTYLRTVEGFLFLALITDKYSRKIVGWHVGDNLEAVGCLRALERALEDLPPAQPPGSLTLRQLEVLRLLGEGYTNKEIAKALEIAVRTVRTHVEAIFEHLEVENRTQAVLAAQRAGLLQARGSAA